MKKVALFAFNGEFMCFIHVLLNALDMHEKGYEVRIIMEGSATGLMPQLISRGNPMFGLYEKAKGLGLIAGACNACSGKTGMVEVIHSEGIDLLDDMSGHPSMARYMEEGFEVVTF